MNKNDLIRLIREVVKKECRIIIQEELNNQHVLKEQTEKKVPRSLNSIMGTPKKLKSTGNVLDDLLAETTQSDWRTVANMTAADAMTFNGSNFEMDMGVTKAAVPPASFIQNAPPAQSVEQARVTEVPDFSAMMNTMKNKGML